MSRNGSPGATPSAGAGSSPGHGPRRGVDHRAAARIDRHRRAVDLVAGLVVLDGQDEVGDQRVGARDDRAAVELHPPAAGVEQAVRADAHPVGVEVRRGHRVGEVEVLAARARREDGFPDGAADVQVDEGSPRHVDRFGEGQADRDGLRRRVGVAACRRGLHGDADDLRPPDPVRRLVRHFGVVQRYPSVVGGCLDGSAVERDASAQAVQARVRAQAHAVGIDVSALHRVGEYEVGRARARRVPGPPHFVADLQPHRRRVVGPRDRYRFVVADPDPDLLADEIASRRVAWRRRDRGARDPGFPRPCRSA